MPGVRFAPSPTGRFHVGNLRTAWVSRQWARARGEPWVVRFEDIDRPRVVEGARERQLEDLRALGLEPAQVELQSARHRRHWELWRKAVAEGAVYPCTCSRREVQEALAAAASAPHAPEALYSGLCRSGSEPGGDRQLAWRFRGADPTGKGDFIVARAPGVSAGPEEFTPAYHWACAIDDADGGYSLLVRAYDLWDAALHQRAIQQWMGAEPPAIFHAALVTRDDGGRLEKRTRGVTLPEILETGLSVQALLAKFALGFALHPEEYAAGRLFGETRRELRVSELGLSGVKNASS
jgi:glutamyl/glutaminyl-tRNA synthetase